MLTNEYFIDQGKVLLSHLETAKKIPLSDPAFVSFFKKWCKKNSIREHCIFDKHGNIQAVDSAGNEFYFVIYTDDLLNQFSDLYNDSKGMSEYTSAVKERKKIPFFGISMEAWQFDHSDWPQYFYMPEKLEGREKYYWVVKRKEN